ncbi:hypothetical protein KUTeg_019418 [Tegillarca granosa]|uniref:Dynein light intermediate chain n=1 Tax=Tegillarca granosa TaxID=220873 RepID=A0ABQ9ECI9_TEGGR|nr:hypothetical protein KUTeg_019418 [Tegillarca granosa]
MAPIGERNDTMGSVAADEDDRDNECGKTTLIAKLQGVEEPKKGSGLEYYYIDENFAHSLVLLVTSMTQPWSIMETLQRWSRILNEHLDRFFQEYTEPEEGQPTSSQSTHRRDVNPLHPTASHTDEDKVLLPLGENTLSHNLGIPIVVVITKTDAISTLEKEHDYKEEHFDFIQQHIRKFCLHSYVVEKDSVFVPTGWDNEKKISILYENLSSMKPDDIYEDVIAKPIMRKPVQRDAEVVAEDEQVFLMKQQTQLSKAPAPGAAGESPVRPQGTSPKPSKTASTPMVATSSPKKKVLDKFDLITGHERFSVENKTLLDAKNPGAQASEGMLANFFNSLLNKNPRAPTNSTSRADKAAVTRDATAELERLRTKKPAADAKPNGPDPAAS